MVSPPNVTNFSLDANHLPALISVITSLLRDRSPLSIGSVAVAFEAVCPTRLDLLHQHYRRLCRILLDVDEWGQVDLMNLLLRYVRTMLPRPIVNSGLVDVDPDVELLLTSAEPLLQNRNPAVSTLTVMTCCSYSAIGSHGCNTNSILCRTTVLPVEGCATIAQVDESVS